MKFGIFATGLNLISQTSANNPSKSATSINQVLSSLEVTALKISVFDGLIILFASVIAGLLMKFIFQRYSNSFSARSSFGNTLLMVSISVAALIAVVKSSLALSLGLVGALSVVRFRTAIKEPYNLSFLLLSICIAISIGAAQFTFALSILVVGSIIAVLAYKSLGEVGNSKSKAKTSDMDTLLINIGPQYSPDKIYKILDKYVNAYLIKTLQKSKDGSFNLTIGVHFETHEQMNNLIEMLNSNFENSELTFYNSPTR